ncbi:imm11 family protein [Myxococcus landrumensis]|uniref:Immunity MXAN-0049 protein domain-containing protein n=1 Tax=Myxococcus landrumensis TaxID=2813577 RepID=A0ABX7N193_9BACT|nr:DUF1629 domain-containing protein [Myxococcus landrumus]QSQ12363.1 hypothetical protein JY572_28935 [Myxococcus landrumus]
MERHFYSVGLADVPHWLLETPILESGEAFDEPWLFTDGRVLPEPGPIKAQVYHPGRKRTFMFAGVEGTPIVSQEIANALRTLAPADVQLFPVTVEGDAEPYFVVNAIKVIDCIHEEHCEEVQHYGADADTFPEYAGEYRWIYGLRIDPAKTEGAQIFRLKKFKNALIVSEEIKTALEHIGNLGVSFERVTGPQERLH